jgi:hypothetical protein
MGLICVGCGLLPDGGDALVVPVVRERAWTSPIWYRAG